MPRWKNRPEGSNWGEFGEDDQQGRLNLLTPERRLRAIRTVQEGRTFTLSLPLDYPGGNTLSHHRHPPQMFPGKTEDGASTYLRNLSRYSDHFCDVVNDDAVVIYTQYSTQWDALAHFGVEFDADGDGVAEAIFYNGFRADEFFRESPGDGEPCARALGIDQMAVAGIQGRGVILDLFSRYGRSRERIGYDALMSIIKESGAEIEVGDFLCLYTGYADMLLEQGKQPDAAALRRSFGGLDGADAKLLDWITRSGIAAICADNPAVEYVNSKPRQEAKHALLPLHEHCLFKLGVHLGELWNLRELVEWSNESGRREFLLTAPPLNLPGGCGSPVTPIATV